MYAGTVSTRVKGVPRQNITISVIRENTRKFDICVPLFGFLCWVVLECVSVRLVLAGSSPGTSGSVASARVRVAVLSSLSSFSSVDVEDRDEPTCIALHY